MTSERWQARWDKLLMALIAAVFASLGPIVMAFTTGLVQAPKRLEQVESALMASAKQDSTQAAALQRMASDISWLTLWRCLEHSERADQATREMYGRLNCASIPQPLMLPSQPRPR